MRIDSAKSFEIGFLWSYTKPHCDGHEECLYSPKDFAGFCARPGRGSSVRRVRCEYNVSVTPLRVELSRCTFVLDKWKSSKDGVALYFTTVITCYVDVRTSRKRKRTVVRMNSCFSRADDIGRHRVTRVKKSFRFIYAFAVGERRRSA